MTDQTQEAPARIARLAGIALAAATGWAAGFFAAVFSILSLVGLNDFEGWQFEIGTAVLGTLGAALGAYAASRSRQNGGRPLGRIAPILGASLALAAVLLDPDFAQAIIGGGIVAVLALTAVAATG